MALVSILEALRSRVPAASALSQFGSNKPAASGATVLIESLVNGTDVSDINVQDPRLVCTDSDNIVHFLVCTMCQQFRVRPHQAAALLSANVAYLAHILVNGIKQSFAPVLAWCKQVYQNSRYMCALICNEGEGEVSILCAYFS